MRKVLHLLFPVFLLLPAAVFSQQLNGRVMNESGGSASGVAVWFQNKSNIITTNADGTFKKVKKSGLKLKIRRHKYRKAYQGQELSCIFELL